MFARILLSCLNGVHKYCNFRTQANYIFWRAVNALIPYMNDEIKDRYLEFEHIVNGIEDNGPRWTECIDEMERKYVFLK